MGRTIPVLKAVPWEENWLGASRRFRLPPWKQIFPENQEWPTECGKTQRTNGISKGNGARKAISFSFGLLTVSRNSTENLSLYFECPFWGLLLDSYYTFYAFLVNIYSAKLSHMTSDEHRQELRCLVVILGLLMTWFFAELEYWKGILKCTVSSRLHPLLFLAKPLWKLPTYICQQSSQILWRQQEARIYFIRSLSYISTLLNNLRETVIILLFFI